MPAIVVIGASSGGPTALRSLVSGLPEGFPAPILIAMHIGARQSLLPSILNESSKLPTAHAQQGEVMGPARIYIAPPDRHLLIVDGRLELDRGPRENYARPAIDPLFRSAAKWYGSDAIGIVLTGELNDGTAGLYEIKKAGGTTIVQDPSDAEWPAMPRSALKNVLTDYCLPLIRIPEVLVRLTQEKNLTRGSDKAGAPPMTVVNRDLARPTAQTCPECGGAMAEQAAGKLTQFRCHIGHAMSAEVLAAAQREKLEQELSSVLRTLNERIQLCGEMANKNELLGEVPARDRWAAAAKEAQSRVDVVRQLAAAEWIQPEAA